MPDEVTEGPWVDTLRQMGARAVADRFKVTGESLHSVCLLHGAFPARVLFAVPLYGLPRVQVVVQVVCWPGCGYRLAWLT